MLKSLKLFNQMVIISGLIGILAVLVFTFIASHQITDFDRKMDENLRQEISNSVARYLISEEARLNDLAGNNAHWSELHVKLQEKDHPWIEKNATKYMLTDKSYDADVLFIYDVRSKYKATYGVLPESVYYDITSGLDLNTKINENAAFIVGFDDRSYLLSAAIITTDEMKNPTGFYVIGTELEKEFLDAIKTDYASRADITIQLNPVGNIFYHIVHEKIGNQAGNVFTLEELAKGLITLEVGHNWLADAARQNVTSILQLAGLTVLIGLLLMWAYLYGVGRNIDKGVRAIEDITYSNYGKTLDLKFSKDFENLENCINKLSKGLQSRDQEIERNYIELITVLIKALEEVDRYTRGHSERVSHYSVELAKAADYHNVELIRIGGLLHDVGKITVDTVILNKPGKLTRQEYEKVKEHPEVGYNILSMSETFGEVKNIVRSHHERYDGSGYPDQLVGEGIPLGARIIAIADVFDALTSRRAYRKRLSVREALQIMDEEAESSFDMELYRCFREIAGDMHEKWADINEAPTVSEITVET